MVVWWGFSSYLVLDFLDSYMIPGRTLPPVGSDITRVISGGSRGGQIHLTALGKP